MGINYIAPQTEVIEIELEGGSCLTLSATVPGAGNDNTNTRSVR